MPFSWPRIAASFRVWFVIMFDCDQRFFLPLCRNSCSTRLIVMPVVLFTRKWWLDGKGGIWKCQQFNRLLTLVKSMYICRKRFSIWNNHMWFAKQNFGLFMATQFFKGFEDQLRGCVFGRKILVDVKNLRTTKKQFFQMLANQDNDGFI